jgi:peptide/nickel transport system ATP-binding protein
VIEDFMDGGAHAMNLNERKRGIEASDPIILDVRDLGKDFYSRDGLFGRRKFEAVKHVSFRLPKGKTLGLVGESGSGKTTVGLTLMRLHEASAGEALFEGRDILAMSAREFMDYKRRIQIIFQNPYASLNPRFIVGQILTEPMMIHGIGASAQERTDLAFEMLQKVGLPEVSFYKYPHEFSGGQRQRIAIARCLTLKPDILICDESVSALDVSVQAQILNLLQDLQDEFHLSYIFISRPGGGQVHLGPGHGDEPGRDHRDRRLGRDLPPSAAAVHAEAALRDPQGLAPRRLGEPRARVTSRTAAM